MRVSLSLAPALYVHERTPFSVGGGVFQHRGQTQRGGHEPLSIVLFVDHILAQVGPPWKVGRPRNLLNIMTLGYHPRSGGSRGRRSWAFTNLADLRGSLERLRRA